MAATSAPIRLKYWGVRGSYPIQSPNILRYGGNTPCVEVRAGGELIILDAGTGLRNLGRSLMGEELFRDGGGVANIFITHTHWDHIQGIPFFPPTHRAGNHIIFRGPGRPDREFAEIIRDQQDGVFFPLPMEDTAATVEFFGIEPGDMVEIGNVKVSTTRLNHPGVALAYRIDHGDTSLAYVTDTGPFNGPLLGLGFSELEGEEADRCRRELVEGLRELCRGTDAVIYDCFFTDEELAEFPTWGHSSPDYALNEIVEETKEFFIFHHSPERSDEQVDRLVATTRERFGDRGFEIRPAVEGLEVQLGG